MFVYCLLSASEIYPSKGDSAQHQSLLRPSRLPSGSVVTSQRSHRPHTRPEHHHQVNNMDKTTPRNEKLAMMNTIEQRIKSQSATKQEKSAVKVIREPSGGRDEDGVNQNVAPAVYRLELCAGQPRASTHSVPHTIPNRENTQQSTPHPPSLLPILTGNVVSETIDQDYDAKKREQIMKWLSDCSAAGLPDFDIIIDT